MSGTQNPLEKYAAKLRIAAERRRNTRRSPSLDDLRLQISGGELRAGDERLDAALAALEKGSPIIYVATLADTIYYGLQRLDDVGPMVERLWEQWLHKGRNFYSIYSQRLALVLILRGEIERAQRIIVTDEDGEILGLAGLVDLIAGRADEACDFFAAGLKALRRELRDRDAYFDGAAGVFYPLALLARDRPDDVEQASRFVAQEQQGLMLLENSFNCLSDLLAPLTQRSGQRFTPWGPRYLKHLLDADEEEIGVDVALSLLIQALAVGLHDERPQPLLAKALRRSWLICDQNGWVWLADQLARRVTLLAEAAPAPPDPRWPGLLDGVTPRPAWRRSLQALADIGKSRPKSIATREKRLVWEIELRGSDLNVRTREQTRKKNGRGFGKGRALGLSRLVEKLREESYFSEHDRRVCGALELRQAYYWEKPDYYFGPEAMQALVGHPLVFWAGKLDQPIDVVAGQPRLLVERHEGGGARLRFEPPLGASDDDEGVALRKDERERLSVTILDREQRAMAAIIGEGLDVPAGAELHIIDALSTSANIVELHSGIEVELADVPAREASSQVRARLAYTSQGLQVELVVRPLGEEGPVFAPGEGALQVIARADDGPCQTRRDPEAERRAQDDLLQRCPALRDQTQISPGRWLFDDPEAGLELLAQLRALGDALPVDWTGRRSLHVRASLGSEQLKLRIGSGRDWFSLSGELRVDDKLVLDMKRLLELTDKLPDRFVPLGDGEFVALSAALKRQLDALRAYTQPHRGQRRIHPLAASLVDEVVQQAGEVDEARAFRERVAELEAGFRAEPDLPEGLHAELRPYQVEGYRWLARLVAAGMGACLADDMGLGKTVQVLAVLLARRDRGPALVVAPTSVLGNWRDQAERFAPALCVVDLGACADRQAAIGALGPGDLLLCSYAIALREAKALAAVQLDTLVLDEAQAIKNASTKRWRAVTALQAHARVLTTGTPVENHLDELWALFEFINPGLLGGRESFSRSFAMAIERDKDRGALAHLKALIAPYILRRGKEQVLSELPPRTDITQLVELPEAERAHYEALRQTSLERLAAADQETGGKPGHIRILAEITRLRRACSNPILVSPDSGLDCAKLAAAEKLLADLREAGHKVLVFSQWVDQLQAMQRRLLAQDFSLCYLDGSTPEKKRRQQIERFQAGQVDAFLISLKAGGQGINLTAANYVVHLDPWWNPAVEDQASDRAHRIGQKKAVTVYRLIVKDSIEQKIVAMHKDKRDLASQILAGGELAAKMSADELLAMIREGGVG